MTGAGGQGSRGGPSSGRRAATLSRGERVGIRLALVYDMDALRGPTGVTRHAMAQLERLAARPEIAQTLITHRFPLDAAAEAFRVAADRSAGAIKVVLEP